MPRATQATRVLAALYAYPERGINSVDFLRLPTIDGGPPITRLAARINELRDEGHLIDNAGVREKCRVYKIRVDGQLFATPPRRTAA